MFMQPDFHASMESGYKSIRVNCNRKIEKTCVPGGNGVKDCSRPGMYAIMIVRVCEMNQVAKHIEGSACDSRQ